ncbi:DUF2262 domain-containing protein [Microbacterium sp.]|uniref:DUF2262 domain-containing protein n=1 Tax=Microbacterium sp. TaxID=51671 RepID=UPI0039E5833D
MTEQQDREAFDHRHDPGQFEITVLVGDHGANGSKSPEESLWTASVGLLGYVDADGAEIVEKGRLSWLVAKDANGANRTNSTWIHDLAPLTQYVVRVRRAAPADPENYARFVRLGIPIPDLTHHFALDEVIERDVHVPALVDRRDNWTRPLTLATGLGSFELERSFGWFSGVVAWAGSDVQALLHADDDSVTGSETCAVALRALERRLSDADTIDARWRAFAAAQLTELANDWRQEASDDEPLAEISPEAFAERIRLSELAIASDGSMTACFDDDDLFWGHTIVLETDAGGTPHDADIAG